jgi:predicted enzyme related to lactoylglutathione lyase
MSKPVHHTISYIEFTTTDVARAKAFYSRVFGWEFKDWGPDYIDFTSGISGGFAKANGPVVASPTAPLVVLYSADLAATEAAVIAAGGTITTPTFEFPGGRRFHFNDGLGNTLGVWSE